MKIAADKVVFNFVPICTCDVGNEQVTVVDLLEVGTPLCPECDREMELEYYCKIETGDGFW
jgi:hypothetical protein